MIYGTAHDDLNGHGQGLGYLTPDIGMSQRINMANGNPLIQRGTPYPNIDIPLSCGIDPNGNSWAMFNNAYFASADAIEKFIAQGSFDQNNKGQSEGYAILRQALSDATAVVPKGSSGQLLGIVSMASIVGMLRRYGVPFTAYQPVPAPTITPTPTPSQPAGPALAPNIQVQAASPAVLISKANSLTVNDFHVTDLSTGNDLSNKVKGASVWQLGGSFILGLDLGDAGGFYFGWAGTGWSRTDQGAFGTATWDHIFGVSVQPSGTTAPSLTIPDGYRTLPENIKFTYPIYGNVPTFNSDGTTSFAGATPFYGLVASPLAIGRTTSTQYIGLDPTKLSAGLYAYRMTDLGPITSPAGRRYEMTLITIIDLVTQNTIGPFFQTTEGGGGGSLISNPLLLASRIITGVATWGGSEVARAAAKKAGVSQANIDLATEAGAALTIAIATAGAASAISAGSGAAAIETGAAFPVAVDAGSATASLILPTTTSVAAMNAAGATLLPASLSLIAPAAASLTVAEAVTAGATAAETGAAAATPAAAAPGSAVLASGAKAATGLVANVGKVLATTAIQTGIKKLTGQLPGVKPPSQTVIMAPDQSVAPATETDNSSVLKWGLGILAAVALLKKHAA